MGPDVENERTTKPDSAASVLSAGLEGTYGAKALEILLAMARLAADGKSLTIAEDWGFGSATVITRMDRTRTLAAMRQEANWRTLRRS